MELNTLNYSKYIHQLNNIMNNPTLKQLGISKRTITNTAYNYPIDLITIGSGKKEIFLVGGTHGSEIITVDFLLYFLKNIPNLNIDFNEITFKIIPLQNPEGFDITTNITSKLHNNYQEKSYEYYIAYRIDTQICTAVQKINSFFNNIMSNYDVIGANNLLKEFIKLLEEDNFFKSLKDKRSIYNIDIFISQLKNNFVTNYTELSNLIINSINITMDKIKNDNNINNQGLIIFLQKLKEAFSNQNLYTDLKTSDTEKLHQRLFQTSNLTNLNNKTLENKINTLSKSNTIPKGSLVTWDATGQYINLNENVETNPGIEAIKQKKIIYGPKPRDNIRNYFEGPIGIPTLDANNFKKAIENEVLENEIKKSFESGNYLMTLLYHGTGGMIYYKPYRDLMSDSKYQSFLEYNEEIANIYSQNTDYRLLDYSDYTGYGDYLRRTYKGILLVELSKMGGNPIAPYGDINNIYQTFTTNIKAIEAITKIKSKERSR